MYDRGARGIGEEEGGETDDVDGEGEGFHDGCFKVRVVDEATIGQSGAWRGSPGDNRMTGQRQPLRGGHRAMGAFQPPHEC